MLSQVLVDLDRFNNAIADFNKAEGLQGNNYVSLGLLSNRALAYEGIYNFEVRAKVFPKHTPIDIQTCKRARAHTNTHTNAH